MASEDKATEGQIKRLYAVLHSVGLDPTQWKKDQNIASYAKLTRAQCSAYIDEVEALEAEQKKTGNIHAGSPRKPDEKETLSAAIERGYRESEEAQKILEEQGRATPQAAARASTQDLIYKYLDMLAQVTEAVEKEDRIPDREKGYATKFVFHAVKDALENGKGGDHEEQA